METHLVSADLHHTSFIHKFGSLAPSTFYVVSSDSKNFMGNSSIQFGVECTVEKFPFNGRKLPMPVRPAVKPCMVQPLPHASRKH